MAVTQHRKDPLEMEMVTARYPYLKDHVRNRPLHMAYCLCYPDRLMPTSKRRDSRHGGHPFRFGDPGYDLA
jgi:hypothetical protein